jgi:hypothetical protein
VFLPQKHVLGVADVQLDVDTGTILDCNYKQALVQGDTITDLQVLLSCSFRDR